MENIVKISIDKLIEKWNPYNINVWIKMKCPITKSEIKKAIDKKLFISPARLKKGVWNFSSRQAHIRRVAWLVENWSDDYPIEIDFGVPSLGAGFELTDGNHRLTATIYLNNQYINASCSGVVSEIEKFIFK